MSVHLSTAEIDAVVGLLMLRTQTSSPCQFSSPAQAADYRKRIALGAEEHRVITTTKELPCTRQIVGIHGRVVVLPTSQVPNKRFTYRTLSCSREDPAAGQINTAHHHHAESTRVLSPPPTLSRSCHNMTPQADSSNVDELYSQRPAVKKRKCLANGPQAQHFKPEAIPSSTHTDNTLQKTQHTARTPLLPQPAVTIPETPTSPIKPTLILTAPTPPSPRHKDQSQTEPQSPPSGSQSPSIQPHQSLPQYHFKIATPTTPTQESTTNFPKKRKKYGTAYEVSRARQIQATGVPRLPGPCHSCARRQRQLDEVAAASAAADGNIGGGLIGTGTRTGIGRFARPQRGDEFLPCTVLSNGSGHADGDGTGNGVGNEKRNGNGGNRGTGTRPTPCARCKSIKMKCEG
ncbi:hypothetical protein B0T13DRAFT_527720 [Neurospora crassa]|nr:hypothetical protein B0T13DRAFT_527720 [Neurospora crassa]